MGWVLGLLHSMPLQVVLQWFLSFLYNLVLSQDNKFELTGYNSIVQILKDCEVLDQSFPGGITQLSNKPPPK